jgi:hypothetical protein
VDELTAAVQAVAWEQARARAVAELRQARADAEAARAEQAEADKAAEGRPDPDLQSFMAAQTGQPALTPAEAIAKHQMMAPPEAAERDAAAPWGTVSRPAVFVGGVPLEPRQAQRSMAAELEADRLLGRADDLHRDLVAYMARHDYPAALAAARAKSSG